MTLRIQASTPGVKGGIVSGANGVTLTFGYQAEADSFNSSEGDYSATSAENTSIVASGPVDLQNQVPWTWSTRPQWLGSSWRRPSNIRRTAVFYGPNGFAKIKEDEYPTWPLGSLLGIELQSLGSGESRWTMEAGPEHANPMGMIHGGVLCDLGDAALSTAYMSTLDDGELFTTVDLTINFLRPVRTDRLEAVGEVIHKGRRIGVSQSDIWNEDGERVVRLSGTCMTIGKADSQSD